MGNKIGERIGSCETTRQKKERKNDTTHERNLVEDSACARKIVDRSDIEDTLHLRFYFYNFPSFTVSNGKIQEIGKHSFCWYDCSCVLYSLQKFPFLAESLLLKPPKLLLLEGILDVGFLFLYFIRIKEWTYLTSSHRKAHRKRGNDSSSVASGLTR